VAIAIHADLEEAKRIVMDRLGAHRALVYLFGSQATGGAHRGSDIDIGVLPLEPLPHGLLFEIAEALENSRILCSVDVVDMSRIEPAFRERIQKEGVPWTR
jgi:predicted nucleotidyltransferase